MALWDRLKDTVQQVQSGGQLVGRMGQLKVQMTKAQARIGELYAEGGIKAYQLYQKKELTHPQLDELFQQIDELNREHQQLKSEYDELSLKIDVQNQDNAQSRMADIRERKSPFQDEEPR